MDKHEWEKGDELIFSDRSTPEARRLAERYGYLPYIVERYLELLGGEAEELLEANEEPMSETIRCNDFKISCGELEARLGEAGFEIERVPFLPHGYIITKAPISPGATHEYLKGYYYLQDPGSMLVVYIMRPRPSATILDMAAAPGGKSTQILQLTRDSALLIAVEPKRDRVRALRSNLQRMGFSNYIIIKSDARNLKLNVKVDQVLLDAPSSGEGIIRKDKRRKTKTALSDLKRIHYLQLELLNKALDAVGSGGSVTYAACSTAVEEGEYVVHKVLQDRDYVATERPAGFPLSEAFEEYRGVKFDDRVKGCGRLFPHRQGTEGFFICNMRRLG
ncbi:RsmB/NOP family class I SAM-dependent RNA methyltransferase [Acidilobus sp. 7A]|uniref:RsmB/NOP family class I SAM-dependent RNA methyltransferase n=1 Tax=Acidilobus sp. 7A TaxID=1577685 RepID=UPI001B3BD29F|nr:RsmB/NOP family class I SAM-dependent RNA methyltransferase [Acidilobus sp. 7A]